MRLGLSSTCGTLTAVSCACSFIAAVLHVVAFGTRRWIVSVEESPFVSIGFFEACFHNCRDPYCPSSGDVGVVYNKCARFWDWYFQEVWTWLRPQWFITCRNLAAANFPLIWVIFIILAICTSLAFKGRYTTETTSNQERVAGAVQVLLFICGLMLIVSCILSMILMTTMYTYGFQRSWMPLPEKNRFGWSFWLEFTVTVLLIISFLLVVTAAVLKTMWLHGDKDPRYSEDMMLGRPSPSPAPPLAKAGTSGQAGTSGLSSLGAALHGLEHKQIV